MTPTLETERLILKPLELVDAVQTQKLFPQWEVVKYLNDRIPWPFPADGVLAFYRDSALPASERGTEWHWTIRLRTAEEEIIGAIDLITEDTHATRGFWLAPS